MYWHAKLDPNFCQISCVFDDGMLCSFFFITALLTLQEKESETRKMDKERKKIQSSNLMTLFWTVCMLFKKIENSMTSGTLVGWSALVVVVVVKSKTYKNGNLCIA